MNWFVVIVVFKVLKSKRPDFKIETNCSSEKQKEGKCCKCTVSYCKFVFLNEKAELLHRKMDRSESNTFFFALFFGFDNFVRFQ